MNAPARPDPRLAEAAAKATPMMAQYLEIKAANPGSLLFYRMGDFYELFFEDAEIASRALGIVLTKRGKHQGDDIPMCGVPVERADDYLQRLIALGHRVAVCEQIEDPAEAKKRGPKSVVQRGVVRLVTPGTITEERLLDPARANLFVTLARLRAGEGAWTYGIAAVDISTGDFSLLETDEAGLGAEVARLEPSEIVAPEAVASDPSVQKIFEQIRAPVTPVGRDVSDSVSAAQRLCAFFGVATLDGFGALTRSEIAAAAIALNYVERTQIGARPNLSVPQRFLRGGVLEVDAATRANLELTRTLSGERNGSLLATINRTVTPAGGRLLAERLAGPLTDPQAILARQDSVDFFLSDPLLRSDVRALLKSAPDTLRSLSRLALQRGGPRDLAALRDGIAAAQRIAQLLTARGELPAELQAAVQDAAQIDPGLHRALDEALAEELPLNRRDGGFIRANFDAGLDELRALRDESRRVIAALQMSYAEKAETKQLKVKHNNFLGYFVEVPQAMGEKLLRPPFNELFIHRQTMADAMRFSTVELNDLEAKIATAGEKSLERELAHFDRLSAMVLDAGADIQKAAQALAIVDVAAALAELAEQADWVRPQVESSLAFHVEGARHPVVEAALKARGASFVANDCDLSGKDDRAGQIALITGPNMAGKSTYLRQNALIVILAQMGSYVPARQARIGIVDRLFSRVGAADDLARGQSTFMVEMVETAAILNQATKRSLVILDEIGRGTATFDGLSIAWATVEHLHNATRARTLFATHFHELTQLTRNLTRLINLTMRVTEWHGDVVFLHEVMPGAADRSYGIQVAKLAGLPLTVVERARAILATLEAGDRQAPTQKLLDDLPLFAAQIQPPPPPPAPPPDDPVQEMLEGLNPDEMTPREALEALYRLKQAQKGGGS
ncbi:DNA mismatch repair protein MutS [Methylovirgula sp. 4M-Z18]|uniref:DNA mismatch repair protein MutS n=1 Tax=Methylovirgula sp. 4M-Z18 TaxID=2293567 RepID=UPI000E2F27EE|nr:DNA mismatch repair protein MutS [Methylovirgula sp. 4M-Z18]RFB79254.1 DNA mismatch repair protein MutS [Methylovirgula sp. 4M-Z18]